ncbi:MAG TPA: class I SAM-dependent methyltransferase [Nitrososphaeraceae archaeon]|nr:class I SAM-dependent methyltransferase [Nitrososphaeraceae archaeon]
MTQILCPICHEPVKIDQTSCVCTNGHNFTVIKNRIIDFLPNIDDQSLKEEEEHWDHYARIGTGNITNHYIKSKIFRDYDDLFQSCITDHLPDYSQRSVSVAEIGCGPGSAIRFLIDINFAKLDYTGIDLSLQAMLSAIDLYGSPKPTWRFRFARASANIAIFKDNSLDIIFSASALHHLQVDEVIKWVSKSLKSGGLFIIHEPSEMNPFARIGRKFIREFHTKGERPLHPERLKKISREYDLDLVFEKGLHFLSGPMMYCVQLLHFPGPLSVLSYSVSKFIDRLVISPSWNYSFIQVYRKP